MSAAGSGRRPTLAVVGATGAGKSTIANLVARFWDPLFQDRDPNDLLAMLWTWQHADISANELYERDFDAALRAIAARAT